MLIKTICPACFRQYDVDDANVGMYMDCPACRKRFRVQGITAAQGTTDVMNARPEPLSITIPLIFRGITLGTSLFFVGLSQSVVDPGAILFFALISFVVAILALVFTLSLHHRCWASLPQKYARTTPGKAVGYLFIPFYNLYWAFQSFAGLGADCVALARAKGLRGHDHLEGVGLGLAIAFCVSSIMPFICKMLNGLFFLYLLASAAEFVLWILFYQGVTKFLNRVAMEEAISPSAE